MSGRARIILSRTGGLGSAIVRAMPPAGPWSHCGVVLGDTVIEARAWRGVVETPLAEYQAHASAWAVVELWAPRPDDGEAWARSTLGARYDWTAVIGIPLRSRAWQHDETRWYCSEHGAVYLARCGQPVAKQWCDHGVTPTHFGTLALAADGKIIGSGGR